MVVCVYCGSESVDERSFDKDKEYSRYFCRDCRKSFTTTIIVSESE